MDRFGLFVRNRQIDADRVLLFVEAQERQVLRVWFGKPVIEDLLPIMTEIWQWQVMEQLFHFFPNQP